MNSKTCIKVLSSIAGFLALSALAFLTACSSSSSTTTPPAPTIAISATSGGGQSAVVNAPFGAQLAATVTSNGSPASGVSVTFTAPSSGASGTFATSPAAATDTEMTNSSGVATSQIFTANATTGSYSVTATTSGASTPATFALTNISATATSATYVYYLSGEEVPSTANGGYQSYFAIAGAVTLDSNGDVVAGEQDYNDGFAITSPGEPNTPDTISAASGALNVDPTTGIGTLTLTSSNTNVGVNGVETFAVQFVNANHALITQFDGTATSSGSLDLQTATNAPGNFAFAITGVNPNYDSVAYGGVYTTSSGGNVSGTIDVNDTDDGVVTGTSFSATAGSVDSFGRYVVTGVSNVSFDSPVTFVSYVVGPEALRIIDVDNGASGTPYDTAIGSAFGQGSTTFTNASLGSSVFNLLGQWSTVYASLGQFGTDGNGNITGIADDNELDYGVEQEASSLSGSTYDLASSGINGYGSVAVFGNGDITSLGLYMTDPALNLNDPNNTTTDTGGALIIDLDSGLPGGMGVVTPQTDTTATDFNGNYAAGFQNFNNFAGCAPSPLVDCELDMVGPFTMVSGGLLGTATIGADVSDPFGTLNSGTAAESTGDTFSSTPLAITAVSPGYFSMSSGNSPANPLSATIGGVSQPFDADIYQASGTTLYWLNWDVSSIFIGPIEAQGSFTGAPFAKKPTGRTKAQTARTSGKHSN